MEWSASAFGRDTTFVDLTDKTLGRYRLVSTLGQCTYSFVYLAEPEMKMTRRAAVPRIVDASFGTGSHDSGGG